MKKKMVVLLMGTLLATLLSGCGGLATVSGLAKDTPYSYTDMKDLESEMAYVQTASDKYERVICGDYNFKGQELAEVYENPRSIWMRGAEDELIPTVTSQTQLLFVSETTVPEQIVFERFADYGYTIGVSNMLEDGGNHYYIPYAENNADDYTYYVDMNSDAATLIAFENISRLYLDKVDGKMLDEQTVSKGGTVLELEKDKQYLCEFYTGTFYQDFMLTADVHSFSSMERFVSYDFTFLHSNCIAIGIPDYFKSGYYYVNGIGLFRYVSDADLAAYNGKAYDSQIDWNDPIIIYDENGIVIENPSDPNRLMEGETLLESDAGEENYELEEKEEVTSEDIK